MLFIRKLLTQLYVLTLLHTNIVMTGLIYIEQRTHTVSNHILQSRYILILFYIVANLDYEKRTLTASNKIAKWYHQMKKEGMYNKNNSNRLNSKVFIKVLNLYTTYVVKPSFKNKLNAFNFTDILYFVLVWVFGRCDFCNHIHSVLCLSKSYMWHLYVVT